MSSNSLVEALKALTTSGALAPESVATVREAYLRIERLEERVLTAATHLEVGDLQPALEVLRTALGLPAGATHEVTLEGSPQASRAESRASTGETAQVLDLSSRLKTKQDTYTAGLYRSILDSVSHLK